MSIYALLGSLKIVYKKKRLNFKNIFQVFQKTYSNARSSIIKEVINIYFLDLLGQDQNLKCSYYHFETF